MFYTNLNPTDSIAYPEQAWAGFYLNYLQITATSLAGLACT